MFPTMLRAPAFPTPAWVSIVASRFLLLLGSCRLLRQLPYLSQRQLPYLQSGNDTKLNLKVLQRKGSEVCTSSRLHPVSGAQEGLHASVGSSPLAGPPRPALPPSLPGPAPVHSLLPPAHLSFRLPLERTEPIPTSRPFLLWSFLVSLLLWHLFIRLPIMDKLPHNTAVYLSKERTFILLHSYEATIKSRHLTLRHYCHRIPDPTYFQLVNCLCNAPCKSRTQAMIVCYT